MCHFYLYSNFCKLGPVLIVNNSLTVTFTEKLWKSWKLGIVSHLTSNLLLRYLAKCECSAIQIFSNISQKMYTSDVNLCFRMVD